MPQIVTISKHRRAIYNKTEQIMVCEPHLALKCINQSIHQ